MSKTLTRALLTITMTIALTTTLASPAAANWFVEGEELAEGHSAALASLPAVDESISLKWTVAGTPIKVSCKGPIHITNGRIIGLNQTYAEKVVFLDCSTVSPTPTICKLEPALRTIETRALTALATEGTFPDGKFTYKPQTGKEITTIPFEEGACAISEVPVKGAFTLNAPTLQEELATQPIEGLGSTENNSLEAGTSKAFIENGRTLLKLTTGERYRILPTDVTVTPKTVHFGAANKVEKLEINAVEDGQYMILEQKVTDDVNDRFSIVGGTSPCLNKKLAKPAKMNEPEKCSFEIQATGLVDGEDAKLVTKYERVPAVFQTTYYNNLEW